MKKKLSESDHFSKKNRTTLLIWNVALFPTLLLFYPFPHTQNVLSWLRISVFPITSLMVTFQPHVCKCSFRVQCLLLPHSDLSLFCCFCLFGVWGGGARSEEVPAGMLWEPGRGAEGITPGVKFTRHGGHRLSQTCGVRVLAGQHWLEWPVR